MAMGDYPLLGRTKALALRIVRLVEAMPPGEAGRVMHVCGG